MRTRSGVGRKPSTSGNLSKRLRQIPALMRTWLELMAFFVDFEAGKLIYGFAKNSSLPNF